MSEQAPRPERHTFKVVSKGGTAFDIETLEMDGVPLRGVTALQVNVRGPNEFIEVTLTMEADVDLQVEEIVRFVGDPEPGEWTREMAARWLWKRARGTDAAWPCPAEERGPLMEAVDEFLAFIRPSRGVA